VLSHRENGKGGGAALVLANLKDGEKELEGDWEVARSSTGTVP